MTSKKMRETFQRILDSLMQAPGIAIQASLSSDGSSITVTAALDGRSERARAASQHPRDLPSADEVLEAVSEIRNAKAIPTMTSIAKHFGLSPRTRIQPIVESLVREMRLKKVGVALRIVEPGEEPKARASHRRGTRERGARRTTTAHRTQRSAPTPRTTPPAGSPKENPPSSGYDRRIAARKSKDRERSRRRRMAAKEKQEQKNEGRSDGEPVDSGEPEESPSTVATN